RNVALSSGSQPPLRAKCVKRMPSRERAVYVASQSDCQRCSLREQCLAKGGQRQSCEPSSVLSAVSCLLLPRFERKPVMLGSIWLSWMWLVDLFAAAGPLDFRRQHVEVLTLAEIPQSVSPPPHPPRAVRS